MEGREDRESVEGMDEGTKHVNPSPFLKANALSRLTYWSVMTTASYLLLSDLVILI